MIGCDRSDTGTSGVGLGLESIKHCCPSLEVVSTLFSMCTRTSGVQTENPAAVAEKNKFDHDSESFWTPPGTKMQSGREKVDRTRNIQEVGLGMLGLGLLALCLVLILASAVLFGTLTRHGRSWF